MYVALNVSAPMVDLVTCWTVSPTNSSVYGGDCLAQEEREVTLTNLKKKKGVSLELKMKLNLKV